MLEPGWGAVSFSIVLCQPAACQAAHTPSGHTFHWLQTATELGSNQCETLQISFVGEFIWNLNVWIWKVRIDFKLSNFSKIMRILVVEIWWNALICQLELVGRLKCSDLVWSELVPFTPCPPHQTLLLRNVEMRKYRSIFWFILVYAPILEGGSRSRGLWNEDGLYQTT